MKKAIIAASFGTTYEKALENSISALENTFAASFPEYEVRRAFTSRHVISALRKKGSSVDTVSDAFEKLIAEGFDEIIVQPTHIIGGNEYERLCREAEMFRERFKRLVIGVPLLSDDDDIEAVCGFFEKKFGSEKAVAIMGHGTEHAANKVYQKLWDRFAADGFDNIFVGAMEGSLTIADIIPKLKSGGYHEIVVTPLLLVAGEHAYNDMAGDGPSSWRSVLEAEGFEFVPVIKGLGEYEEIRSLYAEHLGRTINCQAITL